MTPEQSQLLRSEMQELKNRIAELLAAVTTIQGKMTELQTDVAETKEIVSAWHSAKLMARFSRWFAGFIVTGGTAIAIIKGWWFK